MLRDPDSLKRLSSGLERSRFLRGQPIVSAFIEDLRSFKEGARLDATKAHINGRRDNHIFSLFYASYFPTLSLDYLTYEAVPAAPHVAERYPSSTVPVNITTRSTGFSAAAVVALFPENHVDGRQDPGDLIFYFIDKFVGRHNRITRKVIDAAMAPESFPHIQGASDAHIERASSWWVRLHEHHHQQGDMPIPTFLSAKSAKPLAGLEELRVDVTSMLVCLRDDALPREEALMAFEYVLAERLLRYPIEAIPRLTYDAIGSQVLFNYLLKHEGIHLAGGLIHLRPELPAVLERLVGEIEAIERRIHVEPVENVRTGLREMAHQYADYDPETREFQPMPYFAELKWRLGV